MRRKIIALVIGIVTVFVIIMNDSVINIGEWGMYNHYIENAFAEVASINIVTAIYLNYRYYDTLFEALVLLFSIIAVIYLSVHEEDIDYE